MALIKFSPVFYTKAPLVKNMSRVTKPFAVSPYGYFYWPADIRLSHTPVCHTLATLLPCKVLTQTFASWGRRFPWPNLELAGSEANTTFRHTLMKLQSFARIKIRIQNDCNSFSYRFICLYVSENIFGSNIARCCQGSSRNISEGTWVRSSAMNYVREIVWWCFLIGNTGKYVTGFVYFIDSPQMPRK